MSNGFNPLTAPLTMIKQVGEQASATVASVGAGMTSVASQTLDTLIAGVPALPGVPAAKGRGVPTPQQLMPANLQQVLGRVENMLIPPGLPRPSQALKARVPAVPPAPPAAAAAVAPPPAVAQRRRIAERRGL